MDGETTKKNYSSIAWIVALVAFIAAILLGIVRALVALGAFTVGNVDKLNQAFIFSIGIAILAIATYVILEPERVRRLLTGRQAGVMAAMP